MVLINALICCFIGYNEYIGAISATTLALNITYASIRYHRSLPEHHVVIYRVYKSRFLYFVFSFVVLLGRAELLSAASNPPVLTGFHFCLGINFNAFYCIYAEPFRLDCVVTLRFWPVGPSRILPLSGL
jgi:hypothetical protein